MNLFEYQNKISFPSSFQELEAFLDEIWNKREKSNFYFIEEEEKIEVQRFIEFNHNTKELKSYKYVGFIHFENHKINLLPKIFFDKNRKYEPKEICGMQNHILWWLSYCQKIKFPNYQTALGSTNSDFFEVLIYLFSKFTLDLFSKTAFQQFQEIENEVLFLKGRLNTQTYINENLSRGNWHKFNCTYDSFEFDNPFNQIVKSVCKMLFNVSSNAENKQNLSEILFILDEVTDISAKAEDCQKVIFNPLFTDFETVRDYCYLFLSHSISFNYNNELKLFAFLLPMEYVFEDFIYGFIDQEIPEIKAKAQNTSIFLDSKNKYNLRPDLHLKFSNEQIIADTKYKIVYGEDKDPQKCVSQSDLYQMVAYAIRYNVQKIILFYPDTILISNQKTRIDIFDELAGKNIQIDAVQVPIFDLEILKGNWDKELTLNEMFEECKIRLVGKIREILLI